MGASGHSRRNVIDVALDDASSALRITEDRTSESVTSIQNYQKYIAGKRSEANTYRKLLACHLEVIGQQQHFLKCKDEKIRELQDQIMKLKEKVTNLEKKQQTDSIVPVNKPIKNSESNKEKRLLRSKSCQEKSDSENKMTVLDSHSIDPMDVADLILTNAPFLRRATRTSTAERHSSRRPSSSSSISDASELCSEFSPSKSTHSVEKKSSIPKKLVSGSITSSRLRNPSISSKAGSASPIKSSDPDPLIEGTWKKFSKTNPNDRVGIGSEQRKPETANSSAKQIKSSKTTLTLSSAPEKGKHKTKESSGKSTTKVKDSAEERRTTRNQSSEVVSNNIRKRRASSIVNSNPPNNKRIKEKPTEQLIWESPLILNETENCLTTRIHYHTLERDEELMDNTFKSLQLLPGDSDSLFNVEVPNWREKIITRSNYANGIEDLDDSLFLKRHQKLELDERRRKRWDAQRLREEQYLAKLKSRSDRRDQSKAFKRRMANMGDSEDSGLETFINEIETFQPKLQGATCIRVEEDLPISVFGFPIPIVEPCEFELPWELKPRRPKRSRNEVYYKSSYGNRHT